MGIKKAKSKEVKRLSAADLNVARSESSIEAARVYLPGRTKQTQLFEGDARDVAAKLVEKLRFEARVL
jgi:electron transfer flavoprotein beta subunit